MDFHMFFIFYAIASTIQFSEVPVTLGTGNEWRSVYTVQIENVQKGDLIQAFGEGQARNDLGYNIELAQIVEFKTKEQILDGTENVNGVYQSPINGWNIVPAEHYGRFSKMASWIADDDYDVIYAVLRIRCRSTGAHPDHKIDIQAGQGMFFVNQYRKHENKMES